MALTVTISGSTVTPREITLSAAQNERDRLTAILDSPSGADLGIDIDDEIRVTEDSVVLFGGSIKTPETSGLDGSRAPFQVRVSALDFNELGDRQMLASVTIPTGTLKAAATALLPYLPGVSIDTGWTANPADNLPELVYDGIYADAALEDLSMRTGWIRNIDADKKLKFWAPGTVAAPWNVTDGDGNVFADLPWARTREDYANRIIVRYMEKASSAYAYFGPQSGTNPSDGETCTVGGKTYTFRTTINNGVANEIKIGATTRETAQSLAAAIAELGGKGFTYSTPTTINTQVTAYEQNAAFMCARALTPGAAGNSIACTDTCATWHWFNEGGIEYATLRNGADEAATQSITRDNLTEQATYGVYSRIVQAPTVYTVADAAAVGDAILEESIVVLETVRYETFRAGLVPGMTQTIASALRHLSSASYLITAVETNWIAGDVPRRTVTAIKGSVFRSANWRRTYARWAGSAGSVPSVPWAGGGTGAAAPPRVAYPMGGSRTLWVAPNPTAWSPIPEWVGVKAPIGFAATVRAWIWARSAGITVSCRLTSGSDGITFGTVVASASDVTSQTPVERTISFAAEAGKYYRLEVYPSTNGEGVTCIGYLESA